MEMTILHGMNDQWTKYDQTTAINVFETYLKHGTESISPNILIYN